MLEMTRKRLSWMGGICAVALMAGLAPVTFAGGSCGACEWSGDKDKDATETSAKITKAGYSKDYKKASADIVATAKAAGMFNTLLTAATEAGLVETLQGDGPLTVFAPTDKAFAALPDGTIEALLKDKQALREILLFHVVPGKVMAKDALKAGSAMTVYGQPISIGMTDSQPHVNDANIIKTDVKASNGVIHVIDKVIMPKSIAGVAASNEQFSTLVAAAKAAGLVETLNGDKPLTVFAPTNKAFAKLPAGTVDTLLKEENRDKLTAILTYHVAGKAMPASEVASSSQIATVNGQALPVEVTTKEYNGKTKTKVMIGNARIIATDIKATNGVIHVIDTVLLPPTKQAAADDDSYDRG